MRFNGILSLSILPLFLILPIVCYGNEPATSMTVNYPGVHELSASTQKSLQAIVVDLLKTSNFNSLNHAKLLQAKIPSVQERYRKTVSGHYLIIAFDKPQKLKTVGGNVTVFEIVVGLNRSDYADALFTIDPEGRVLEHAKYSGEKCIELLNAVREVTTRK